MTTQLTFLKADVAPAIREQARDAALVTQPFPIHALFNGGVPGDYFVTDKKYLYQDRVGTVPVTAVNDPVRAIRGSVKGILAAVPTDGAFWTYIEENGAGKILGRSTGASRGFAIEFADLTFPQLLGWHADDHGFLVAGLSEGSDDGNAVSVLADENYTWFYVDQWQYSAAGSFITYAGLTIMPAGLTAEGTQNINIFRRRPELQIDEMPRKLLLARNGQTYRAISNWAEAINVSTTLVPLTESNENPLILDGPPPLNPDDWIARGGGSWGAMQKICVFGFGQYSSSTDCKARASLLLGKAVDPVLHQIIMESI
jgi:hypothetical protein